MTWGAVGGAAVSVIGGALLGGGSKSAERAAKDSAARAQFAQEAAQRQSLAAVAPYQETGQAATKKLSQLLGIADPEGYAAKPTLQQFEDQLRDEHFRKYGKDYGRNSNIANQNRVAKAMYDQAMSKWETGREQYLKDNPVDPSEASLLKNFTNEDFVRDPGYEFRQAEGEKGINRALSARGGFNSGAALKALDKYNQDYASNEFSNAYNRDAANKARTFSFLSGASGQGLQGAGMGIGANTNAANQSSQIQQNLGSNLANMYTQNADNQSNMFQSAVGNALYAYERNKPVTGANTGAASSSGYSSAPTSSQPWYLS